MFGSAALLRLNGFLPVKKPKTTSYQPSHQNQLHYWLNTLYRVCWYGKLISVRLVGFNPTTPAPGMVVFRCVYDWWV